MRVVTVHHPGTEPDEPLDCRSLLEAHAVRWQAAKRGLSTSTEVRGVWLAIRAWVQRGVVEGRWVP